MVSATHQHEFAIGIHVSHTSWTSLAHSSPPYPSRLWQNTSFGCPASCIKLMLDIFFTQGNVYVLMLFSQITPPSPFPTESKSLFFLYKYYLYFETWLKYCSVKLLHSTVYLLRISIILMTCSIYFTYGIEILRLSRVEQDFTGHLTWLIINWGFPDGISGKGSACQCM